MNAAMEKAAKSLANRGFSVKLFDNGAQAADYLAGEIRGKTVGIGGSVTAEQLGLFERLSESNEVFWHWHEKTPEILRAAAGAGVFITSANAVSETGELVNIDGRGNRVAATLYDKEAVYFVAGRNKLCKTLDEAIARARNTAAPLNAKRLGCETPCAVDGKCRDCRSPGRICRSMVITMAPMLGMDKVEVVLIDEELGL